MASIYLNIGMSFDSMGASDVIVSADQITPPTHEYLFHFLDADLGRLNTYMESYLECLNTDAPADKAILQRLYEELFLLHPYYRICPANADAMINQVVASYINRCWPEDTEAQHRAMAKVAVRKYLPSGQDFAYWLHASGSNSSGYLLEDLQRVQESIRRWVFLALDNTNADLARLTSEQRNSLYCLIYGRAYVPMLTTKVEKDIQLPYHEKMLGIRMDFDEDYEAQVHMAVAQMQKNPEKTPELVQELIQAAARMQADCEFHTYLTETLEDVLKYEIYSMTQEEKRIKRCKYCGKYFVVGKGNVEYCDRIAAGETKPCSEIGSTRTYEKRVADGGTAMALYRKAYKTHFARIRTGKMTKDQFEAWKEEATAKRQQTESGDMDIDAYAGWLKK